MIEFDKTNLKRDYIFNPLKRIKINTPTGYTFERPYKEDLEYLYNTVNLSIKDLQLYFGLTRRIIQTILKEYGIKKDKANKINHKKYSEEEKNHMIQKMRQTKLERYGDENYNNRRKTKQTCLEKYGCENVNQRHISKDTLNIIHDKNLLEKYIKENKILNSTELSIKLNMSEPQIARYILKYNMKYLFDYTKSIIEKDIKNIISQKIDYIGNYIMPDTRKEIDIYIPKLNIGIEFNGNYWHNEYNKNKKYHQEKSLLAEEKGIFIYHIFEYEWFYKKDKIINQLNNLLGINTNKIYARKCIIKEVDNKEKLQFLESNHLQGNDSSSVKLGLYYENKLVSLMTFVKPRFNKKYEWELSRFCSKANTNVIGGASKLFKYFVDNYNPQSIISYSNIAHTKGKLYETLGFTFDSISDPNYVWCNHGNILTRYDCQKHKLLKQGYEGNSETEIMHNNGYYRIFDCGNKVWVWNNNT